MSVFLLFFSNKLSNDINMLFPGYVDSFENPYRSYSFFKGGEFILAAGDSLYLHQSYWTNGKKTFCS